MANASLKKDFRNGEKLFDFQLNNNFSAIEEALKAMNRIAWQDQPAESFMGFRGTTEEIQAREIVNGQLLYDTTTGETFIDYNDQRISTGSGNAIHIGEDEPENPSTQIWINPEETLNNLGTEVVDSLEGNQTNMSPSVRAVKNYVNNYSEEEKVIGMYEGKPLYTKTINFGSLPNNTYKEVAHGVENYDVIFVDFSASYATLDNQQFQGVNSVGLGLTTYINNDYIICSTNGDRTSWVAVVTIKYTKTTDGGAE